MGNKISGVALWAFVLALIATQTVMAIRMSKLQEQLAAAKTEVAAATPGSESPAKSASGTPAGATSGRDNAAASTDGSRRESGGSSEPSTGEDTPGKVHVKPVHSDGESLLTAKEVEDLVEKKLKEHDKKNPLAQIFEMEDPLVVMERELNLAPQQKTRIKQHMDDRDAAMSAMYVDATPGKMPDPKEIGAKMEEIRKKYEEDVKRELDLAQQTKYDELKRKGKLNDFGGGAVTFAIGQPGDDGEDGKEPAK